MLGAVPKLSEFLYVLKDGMNLLIYQIPESHYTNIF